MTKLSGTVDLSGTGQQSVPVAIIDYNGTPSDPSNWSIVATTTTDANGDWEVSGLANNAVKRYHAIVQYDSGGQLYNALSKPYLSTDAYLTAGVQSWGWDQPTASIPNLRPDSGVSRYRFDEGSGSTATDSWGDNDGTINGAAYTTSAQVGSHALSFDGTDDEVSLGDVLDLQPLSVSAWIYPTSVSEFDPIVAKFGDGPDDSYRLVNNSGTARFDVTDGTASGGSISTNTWYLVTGVNDGSESRVYLDDSQVGSTSLTGNQGSSDTLYIGRDLGGNYFGGRIDDVRFYDKALTDTEVSNLYSTGSISG